MSFRVSGITKAIYGLNLATNAVTTKATNVLFSTQAAVCKAFSYIKVNKSSVAEPPIAEPPVAEPLITELPVTEQQIREQLAQLQVKLANSAHISLSGKPIVADPAPAVELTDSYIPPLGITLTQDEMLTWNESKHLHPKDVIVRVK
jgi:hypothetical protein